MSEVKVLDKGFVRLVDIMGDDSSIVQAARVSYGEGTKTVSDDRTLIRYLMRHRHTTPFEMVELKFHVKVPMDCWRQWVRHRTANINEVSTRYSEVKEEFHYREAEEYRLQSKGNKQGSEGEIPYSTAHRLNAAVIGAMDDCVHAYKLLIEEGVAREQARSVLPLSTYTEAYWKIDLHNLLHFLELRMSDKAQYEIRMYAQAIGQIVSGLLPETWSAFEDYRLNAVTFTALDIKLLKGEAIATPARELAEFIVKLKKCGLEYVGGASDGK